MKNKILSSVLIFLLLIPFRLPISILIIKLFRYLVTITSTENISLSVLSVNIIITKIIYNLVLSIYFIYNIEIFSREKLERKPQSKDYAGKIQTEKMFYWTVLIGILLGIFVIVDSISMYDIFFTKK